MNLKTHYDYIIAGAGCAGLALLVRILEQPSLQNKSILLVDKAPKQYNDRTWCFWEKGPGFFEPIVYHRWNELEFLSPVVQKKIDITPYSYKMIRGIDYYNYCMHQASLHDNVTLHYASITQMGNEQGKAFIEADGKRVYAGYVFNSALFQSAKLPSHFFLLQHFKGWIIKTATPVFTVATARLMDFRVSQQQGCAFFYVLPFSETEALVEFTMFSAETISPDRYVAALEHYIATELQVSSYSVMHEENGVIPMTNSSFPLSSGGIINIGTAAGNVKPSSGYAFRFIQQHSQAMVQALVNNQHPGRVKTTSKKFAYYDAVLLNVLHHHPEKGAEIFSKIFSQNNHHTIFRFLDNTSTLAEDLAIINSLASFTFVKAGLSEMMKKVMI